MAASPVLEILSKDRSASPCFPSSHSNSTVFGKRRKSTSPLLNITDLNCHEAIAYESLTDDSIELRAPLVKRPRTIACPTPSPAARTVDPASAHVIPPTSPAKSKPAQAESQRNEDPRTDWLTELAIIATGPQSPLLRDVDDEFTAAAAATVGIIHPALAWNCFLPGSKLRSNDDGTFLNIEEIRTQKRAQERVGIRDDDQLQLTAYRASHDNAKVLLATFHSGDEGNEIDGDCITAAIACDHPFIVKGKGWCSLDPETTERRYKQACRMLEVNDVCLPCTFDNIFLAESGLCLSELDSDAVLVLSNMARQRSVNEASPLSSPAMSDSASGPPKSTVPQGKKRLTKKNPDRVKRPMNAFMLFAKRYRTEITQDNPGKDNRTISVILGDKWKEMSWEEREKFVIEAKYLAKEHKRLNPDCWKRRKDSSSKNKSSLMIK
ncbi:HMG box-containing protein 1-like isoform X2 [Oscarella lobularis]|uniref:HMG box-containing protein 1-like isoform X2 n=1 Tax=Oscarella lobularis TaxID=121494 RepID=UPI0033138CF5